MTMKRTIWILLLLTIASLCFLGLESWGMIAWPRSRRVNTLFGLSSILTFGAVPVTAIVLMGVHLFKNEWMRILGTGFAGFGCFVALGVVNLIVMIHFADIDHFADDLKLPEGVVLSEPVAYTSDKDLLFRRSDPPSVPGDILLYRDSQGGRYEADVWCNPKEVGTIYLRAFEITTNTELSNPRLLLRTEQAIDFNGDTENLYLYQMKFIIYEGNWGQYYGARFEVWFKPSNGTPERKLLEKNYKIDGWMR